MNILKMLHLQFHKVLSLIRISLSRGMHGSQFDAELILFQKTTSEAIHIQRNSPDKAFEFQIRFAHPDVSQNTESACHDLN
jgi:hypothetical protein